MAARSGITGAKELERVLRKLPGRLAERELTSAARAGANVIRKEARARAPRGSDPSAASEKYGPLHKNIRVARIKKTGFIVEMAIHNGRAFWGSFLEFGTRHIAARPWMSPAFDTSVRPALAKVGERLGKGLEKTAKELAGPLSKISKGTRRRL